MTGDYPDDLDALMNFDDLDESLRQDPSTPDLLGVVVVDWRKLSAEAAAVAWRDLREWVEWFTVRYSVSESMVPACWYKHGALVEELSALRTAHVAAFDATDSGFGPISWHERWHQARSRLNNAYAGTCRGGHQPAPARTWGEPTDWDDWVGQGHGEQP